jgi:hypothetical protein
MGRVEHVVVMRNTTKYFLKNVKGICHLGDVGVDWKIILKFVLRK